MEVAARLFLLVAVAAALAGRSDAGWCVCRTDMGDVALQKTLDYACGAGADCKPILQNGACYNPDNVKAHCSYAVNSFYQRNNQNAQACIFSGTSVVVSSDPSGNGCTYPATPSAAATRTGVDSPPATGPSSANDSSGTGALPVAGVAARLVILASCSLMALYLSA
ncbi:hypothetical protein HU200_004380 [Digitaria exilis]|uniref:X8 domain-containing protein n=1 Tax=Digitaria exilis TaxID=1010633 RepID=A0A835FUV4_9POAL|nr:hypothetical protein HU200_004380 [Digitaria exilis]